MKPMKKCLVMLCLVLSFISLIARTQNGYMETIDGKLVLRVKGTHYERGYAQGYLLGNKINNVMNFHIISIFFTNSSVLYNQARTFFIQNFTIEDQYLTESQAVIAGMTDSGSNLHLNILGREMDYIDLLMANSIYELYEYMQLSYTGYLGCSSLSSWGQSTIGVPGVEGQQIFTRYLDWYLNAGVIQNQVLVIHFPEEPGYQKWLNFGVAGLIGSLSSVNEHKVGVFVNVGNHHEHSMGDQFKPLLLSLRNAIERYDRNNDGVNNYQDVASELQATNKFCGYIIHTAQMLQENEEPVVFEVNHQNGVSIRTKANNQMSPVITGDNLVATNHFRTLYEPEGCTRYQKFSDSLMVNPTMTPERSYIVMKGAGYQSNNLQSIQYIPALNQVKWATTSTSSLALSQMPTEFNLDYLFTFVDSLVGIDSHETQPQSILAGNYPNPFNPSTHINFTIKPNEKGRIDIFNMKGQKVKTFPIFSEGSHSVLWEGKNDQEKSISSGIYFYRLQTESVSEVRKMIMMK